MYELISTFSENLHQGFSESKIRLLVLKRNMGTYNAHIICCEVATQDELERIWTKLVDNVAIFIQANLSEFIEQFNIYIIFFSDSIIERSIKDKIENDKYSSRKIIIGSKLPTDIESVKRLIDKRLFQIDIQERKKLDNKGIERTVKDAIGTDLYSMLTSYNIKKDKSVLSLLLNSFEDLGE